MASYARMDAKWITLTIAAPILAAAVSCSPPLSGYLYAEEPDPRQVEYVLGPSDEISVSVWNVPDMSRDVQVGPDGSITVPLIGPVRAAGRTPSELRDELQLQLKEYVKDESAVVTVVLLSMNSYRVTVVGRVTQPGVFSSDYYLTVGEAIANAGGTTPFARSKRVVLTRQRPDGTVVRIPIRYDLVATGVAPEQNLLLLNGDQIYVP